MNFENVKLIYSFLCLALCLFLLLPAMLLIISTLGINSAGEEFSELWILGPNEYVEGYPLTTSLNRPFKVYLGAGNSLNRVAYYVIYVKLRNQIEPSANSFAGKPSPLQPIFEYRFSLANNGIWEKELSFSFEDVGFDENLCRLSRLSIDGSSLSLDKVAFWDVENEGFYYQLFFELWIYNSDSLGFEFHNRSVGLWINMSSLPSIL